MARIIESTEHIIETNTTVHNMVLNCKARKEFSTPAVTYDFTADIMRFAHYNRIELLEVLRQETLEALYEIDSKLYQLKKEA